MAAELQTQAKPAPPERERHPDTEAEPQPELGLLAPGLGQHMAPREPPHQPLHQSLPSHSTASDLRHRNLLMLQRTHGNTAVGRMIQRRTLPLASEGSVAEPAQPAATPSPAAQVAAATTTAAPPAPVPAPTPTPPPAEATLASAPTAAGAVPAASVPGMASASAEPLQGSAQPMSRAESAPMTLADPLLGSAPAPEASGMSSVAPAACVAPVSGRTTVELATFLAQISAQRNALGAATQQRQASIRVAATQAKASLQLRLQSEQQRMEQSFDQAEQQVELARDTARNAIRSQREAQITSTDQATLTARQELQQTVQAKQAEVYQVGGGKALRMIQGGQEQADLARRVSYQRANRVWAIGSQIVATHSASKRLADITSAVQGMARDTATQLRQGGDKLAATAKQEAENLAAKFHREAQTTAMRFSEVQHTGNQQLNQEHDEIIKSIGRIARETLASLESSSSPILTQIRNARQSTTGMFSQALTQGQMEIDHTATQACTQLDQQATAASAQLDGFGQQISQRFALFRGPQLQQALNEAQAQVSMALGSSNQGQDQLVTQTSGTLNALVNKFGDKAAQQVDLLIQPVLEQSSGFAQQISGVAEQASSQMSALVTTATSAMQKVVTESDRSMAQQITEVDTLWEGQLNDGLSKIQAKVSEGLAAQESMVNEFRGQAEAKAAEIESENDLTRVGHRLIKLVVGFAQHMIVPIIILVVTAVVLILIDVVIISLLPQIVIGFIIGLALFVLVHIEIFTAILVAVTIFSAVITAITLIMIHVKWLNLDTNNISDDDLGLMAGKDIADAVSNLLKVPSKWLSPQLEKTWEFVDDLLGSISGSKDIAEELLGGDEAQREQLLEACNQNEARLGNLLNVMNNDPAKLKTLLEAVGNNGARLERLLGMLDNDPEQLKQLLERYDPNTLEQVLTTTLAGDKE